MSRPHDHPGGSFRDDLDWLLEELSKPAIIELGNPPPQDKYLPVTPAARCPATHNRFLIDGAEETDGDEG